MQTMWIKEELDIIRSVFSREEERRNLRDVFFQFSEDSTTKYSKETLKIIRKIFLPELSPDLPTEVQRDLYFALNTKELSPDVAVLQLEARDKAIAYLNERLDVLEGAKGKLKLLDLKQGRGLAERYSNMLAYQFLAGQHMTSCLNQLEALSRPEETEEEKKTRELANSSK